MAQITLKGNTINTVGNLTKVGEQAKDFKLVTTDLGEKTLGDYKGNKVVLNIFPSIDTGTCATSVRKFNEQAASYKNTKVLCISRDLPFAMARFCGAEGIENAEVLSDFREGAFGNNYGLTIIDGPLEALHSRVVIVLDEAGKVVYAEQVSEITNEPNYQAALSSL